MDSLLLLDILTSPTITLSPDASAESALKLMRSGSMSALVVVNQEQYPVGIFTEHDSLKMAYSGIDPKMATVAEVMGKPPLVATSDVNYREGYKLISEHFVRNLIVVDDAGRLVGLVTENDFLKHLSWEFMVHFKRVGILMTRNVVVLEKQASVKDAVDLMVNMQVSSVVVVDENRPVGIFTERDMVLLEAATNDLKSISLAEVMSAPVISITENMTLPEAIALMEEASTRRLVVTDENDSVVGIITHQDIVKQLYDRHIEYLLESLKEQDLELIQLRDQIRVERALRLSEDRLAESQRLTHIGSWELNHVERTLWCSDEAYRIFGFDAEQDAASYDLFLNHVHSDDRQLVEQTFHDAVAHHKPYELIHRLQHDDGEIRYVIGRCETFYDEGGTAVRSIGTVQDITQHHQAELVTKQNHLLLDSVVDGSADPIFVKDEKGVYIFANQALANLVNKTTEEIVGQTDYAFFPEEIANNFRADDLEVMAKKSNETFDEEVIVDDKSMIYLTTKGPLILDGEIKGIFGIARDITPLRQARNELHNRERFISRVLGSSLTGIYIYNLTEGKNDYINARYSGLTGYSLEEINDMPSETFINLFHPDNREEILAHMSSFTHAEDGEVKKIEYRFLKSDGDWMWCLSWDSVFERDESGAVIRFIGTFVDITEQKSATDELTRITSDLARAQRVAKMGNWTYSVPDKTIQWSRGMFDIFGREADDSHLNYETLLSWIHPLDRANHDAYMQKMLALTPGKTIDILRYRLIRPNQEVRWVEITFECEFNEEAQPYIFFGTAQDITHQKMGEELLLGQQHILELISRGSTSLTNIFEEIVSLAESQFSDIAASILLLENNQFRLGAAPSMPDAYNALLDGLVIGPNVGSCGTAAYRAERVIVADVATDPLWVDYRDLGARVGFRACWSEPVLDAGRKVLGTFALYRSTAGEPTLAEIHLIEGMARLASIAIERIQSEQLLSRADSEWTQVMDNYTDVIYLADMNRQLLRANKSFYKMIGATAEQCLGRSIEELLHPQGEEEACPICIAQKAQIETVITMEPGDAFNPTDKPMEVSQRLVFDKNDKPCAMLVSIHDLSHTRKTEERLRLAASVFDNTDEGVVITDTNSTVIEVNRAFTDITGYTRQEVVGQNPRILKSGHHDESFYRDLWSAIQETDRWRGELWNRRKDGSIYPEWMTISCVRDRDGALTHYIGVFTDISQIKRSQEQLDHLAHHDSLTNLPNRLLLHERLDQAIKHAERSHTQLAVIFIDLDNFKNINDSLGHPIGDQLLQSVAVKLSKSLRQGDTVARLGGDEFVLLLDEIDQSDHAAVMARKIKNIFAAPFLLDNHEIHVTTSMGICLYPQDGTDRETLLRNADAAMYRAKQAGRDNFQYYTKELTQNAFERVLLESSLRKAIEQNQLALLYQPQLMIENDKVVGVEALIRWNHPDLGMISPVKFIPIAEETGLIHLIGRWVMRTACKQGMAWLKSGVEFGRIAINLSGPEMQRKDLASQIKLILTETGFPAERMELEVTESFIMQGAASAVSQLNELRELGVTLSIDDFGTGYSSLSYLKQLPIHKLKVDRSFVSDIPDDKDDMAITQAIIAMGHSLGLNVIAEGVETMEQVSFLKQAGCLEVQGFLYSKPISPDEIITFLSRSKPIEA
ncbi:EAL domain-containing protein [Sedimenticola selenatireducens]|uniref:cyclic-guanylate-specific phosphodiesterase n=1 Tax=Sedimenticola selenatireducens TaxID=191960 RepID=A0A557RY48_9GAMM|nr:EAL domain-containing protein [Sedimenticola selenatireducens]TVO70038.1 EAL domain-containing protein [Sedimenticola selenatireducens]TVT61720.1 MAG: EAL domain-containing protein [Sedimenticola selenatireducens]